MTNYLKTLSWLLTSLGLFLRTTPLMADAGRNPYDGIAVRNLFNLHEPPQTAATNVQIPLPKITVLGTTDILVRKFTVFKVQLPGNPPNTAKEQTFTMAEGDRREEIEVLEI